MASMSTLPLLLVTFLLLGILTAFYTITYLDPLNSSNLNAPEDLGSRWWGSAAEEQRGGKTSDDLKVERFTISVTDKELADLRRRLEDTVYPSPLEGVHFEYGFNTHYLRNVVVEHWLNGYNWTLQQAWLNSFEHWTTRIDGIRVHYVHTRLKKSTVPPGVKVLPIMLIHGWPGSFVEFLDLVSLLTKMPVSSHDGLDFVFEVVCPSIPGYGFSEAPHQTGFGQAEAAHMFDKLMQRLGYESYYVHGGDWGNMIATNMARLFPQRVKGVHVNMLLNKKPSLTLKMVVGSYFPWLFGIDETDYGRMYPIGEKIMFMIQESGYMHIQATKPDTVGLGLANSPAALAAYILEKFSTWTDKSGVESSDGKLTDKFSLDKLLTNVMVYWMTGSITSSQRFYKEHYSPTQIVHQMDRVAVVVPAGVASFPNEIVPVTRMAARETFQYLVSFTYMPRGGHFAAFEEPQLMSNDIKHFVRIVESGSTQRV